MAYVIHSMVPDPGMPLPEMENWFEAGTRKLLELAIRDKCEGFLLCSTGAVYQPQGRALKEEDPLIPLDAPLSYGRIRRQVEDQCLKTLARKDVSLKIARGFSFVGPRLPEDAGFALVEFLRDAREGKSIRVRGTGAPVRSYLYASDMATWLWKIFLDETTGRIFNVGSPEGLRLIDLATKIGAIAGSAVQVLCQPDTGAALNGYFLPDTTKARLELRLSPGIRLENLLEAAHSQNPKAYP